MQNYTVLKTRTLSGVATNSVLRKTYLLLSLTLLFSAFTAYLGVLSGARPGTMITILGMFGLLFLTQALKNSVWGLVATFAFTGFMGYTLAPILSFYLHGFVNGAALVATAAGGTGMIFLLLSGFVLVSRKDFSYMGGFLFAAIMVAFLVSLFGLFFQAPLLQLIISGVFMLLCSGLILFHTSQIMNGGETNYIMATISLYVAIFNIFISLLQILGVFAGGNSRN